MMFAANSQALLLVHGKLSISLADLLSAVPKRRIMALTTWNDSYSVKIETLDAQHKNVIEMINGLADAMRKGHGSAAIQPTLIRLMEHLRIHLRDEEDLMQKCGYPELTAHKEEHHRYVLRVEMFKTDLEKTGNEDTVALLYILRDIILEHMLQTDLAYSANLNANGIH
jgi:hemerythrin